MTARAWIRLFNGPASFTIVVSEFYRLYLVSAPAADRSRYSISTAIRETTQCTTTLEYGYEPAPEAKSALSLPLLYEYPCLAAWHDGDVLPVIDHLRSTASDRAAPR